MSILSLSYRAGSRLGGMSNPQDPSNLPGALARAAAGLPTTKPSLELEARRELRAKYQDALTRLWTGTSPCPICGTDRWDIADVIETPLRNVASDLAWALANTQQAYVYVPVGCTNCGYTIFFHSGTLDRHTKPS
jgi:predicted nucleic-acid-binding Zn-ribbon protein